MKRRRSLRIQLVLFALGLVVCGTLWQGALIGQESDKSKETTKRPTITTETLGGQERFLTFVSTDKPMYKPGETIYMRGVLLHHTERTPIADDVNLQGLVEIFGPKGDTVASGYTPCEHSSLGFSWTVPEEQAGGEYTINISYPSHGYTPAERKFDVRAYRPPRLKSQIKFLRDGYGPGDKVAATLHTERAEGGVPAGAAVTVIARVDGEEVHRGKTEVDEEGNCLAKFSLPPEITRGEGTLAMVIEDGGVVETASKTIPILLQTVDLIMYPEGGDLIAGLPNQVYFEAFTPAKKPADLAGIIVDSKGKRVARFRSEHEGRGRFGFTPKAGETYAMKITEPSGIQTQYALPEAKTEGVVLTSHRNVTAKGEPVQFGVAGSFDGPVTVTLSKREAEIAAKSVKLKSGKMRTVVLDPGTADGVLIATVWSAENKPLAERLIFCQPKDSVNIKISADAEQYVPGGKASLTVETTDDNGDPISAVVGLTVTDDSVLEMIDKREQAPRLPVMVLLENEVKELADAHIYLDPQDPVAPLAVDLLLGTQGWRRFALVNSNEFIEEQEDAARRVLALRIVTRQRLEEVLKAEMEAMDLDEEDGGVLLDAVRGVQEKGGLVPDLAVPLHPGDAPPPPMAAAPEEPMDGADPFGGVVPADPKDAAEPFDEEPAPVEEPVADEPAPEPDPAPAAEIEAPPVIRELMEEQSEKRKQIADRLEKVAAKRRERALLKEDDIKLVIRDDFVAVRVYAHEVRPDRQPGQRVDFTETLYWHAGLKTDETTGQATFEFGLNDSVTSFRVFADAFSADGTLGTSDLQIDSVEPFYVEPKLPLEVTSGDEIQLPIGVVNATTGALEAVSVTIDAGEAFGAIKPLAPMSIAADERIRRLYNLTTGTTFGEAAVTLSANAGPYADRVTRTVSIKPQGFPIETGFGAMAVPGGIASAEIDFPAELVPGSVKTRAIVYPTPLANLTEALERLIREPYGCFEQTSSTTYPLVMAQQYFQSHEGVDPALIERSAKILDKGYNRLLGFECKSGGYEWFGEDPGHEALTAYGLLEFSDMSQVYPVDELMLDRTREWLLGTRDGKGEFTRKRRALHTWITEPECSNGYIMWSLLESGLKADGMEQEVTWLRSAAETSQNTYSIALAANVLALADDEEGANHLLDKLAGKQTENGSLEGATQSIVGSRGQALEIETTSLAVLAWLRNPRYAANVEKSIKYLAESCKAGRFGSTQSTVLALRAIIEYDQSRAKPKAPGSVQLVVDGQNVGQPIPFDEKQQGAIELPDFSEWISPGKKHKVAIKMTDGSDMPCSVTIDFNTLKPASAKDCNVHLETKLLDTEIDEGATTEVQVVAINRTGEAIPNPVAIIGIPGGLEVRHDQLKELVKEGRISAYEVLGREVVLYWRSLTAEQRVELPLSVVAAIPGKYTGPASRAYEYYTDEHKIWNEPLYVEISPK